MVDNVSGNQRFLVLLLRRRYEFANSPYLIWGRNKPIFLYSFLIEDVLDWIHEKQRCYYYGCLRGYYPSKVTYLVWRCNKRFNTCDEALFAVFKWLETNIEEKLRPHWRGLITVEVEKLEQNFVYRKSLITPEVELE